MPPLRMQVPLLTQFTSGARSCQKAVFMSFVMSRAKPLGGKPARRPSTAAGPNVEAEDFGLILHGRASMAELTEQQRETYWQYNIRLTTVLLVIWFVTAYVVSGLLAGWLNQFTFLGFPLGYYMAAQGSLAIFVIEIAVYAYLMNKKDREYGIVEVEEE
jgi:putative solute:sodium symporter small subunit